jgi:hypothetical protein
MIVTKDEIDEGIGILDPALEAAEINAEAELLSNDACFHLRIFDLGG